MGGLGGDGGGWWARGGWARLDANRVGNKGVVGPPGLSVNTHNTGGGVGGNARAPRGTIFTGGGWGGFWGNGRSLGNRIGWAHRGGARIVAGAGGGPSLEG